MDLKLDIGCSTMRGAAPAAARWAVERSDEYLCTGGAYR